MATRKVVSRKKIPAQYLQRMKHLQNQAKRMRDSTQAQPATRLQVSSQQ